MAFEYGTLNGGEESILAMLREHLTEKGGTRFTLLAAVPEEGPLSGRLRGLGVETIPMCLRDTQGGKLPVERINQELLRLVERVKPDLVHANSLSMGRMWGRVAAELEIPCTAHVRDIIKLSRKGIADLNQMTGLIAVSEATKSFHVAQGLEADKVEVIHNGVDLKRFAPRSRTGMLQEEFGIPESAFVIANIGQICLRKGQQLLAEGAVEVAEEFPEIHFLIVGERHSQKQESVEYEQGIREIFREAGIEERLVMTGYRSDVNVLLNEVDMLVHTAHQEPLGRVLLEGAAAGVPIVATDVGGTSEILRDRESALLIQQGSKEDLVEAVRELRLQEGLRARLGQCAREQAEKKFGLAGATAEVSAFWKRLLQS